MADNDGKRQDQAPISESSSGSSVSTSELPREQTQLETAPPETIPSQNGHVRSSRRTLLKLGAVVGGSLIVVGGAAFAAQNYLKRPAPTVISQVPQVKGITQNFNLYIRTTQVVMPDKTKIWCFGFTDDPKGSAKVPAPPIIVNEGDTVHVTLHNDKDPTKSANNPTGDGHTVHMHGLDLPSAMDGDPMTAPGGHAVMEGQSYTYSFVAKNPGTYWYHCHSQAAEHIQMGMYGALVIRPNAQPKLAYPGTSAFDKEYIFVLSDMDSGRHQQDYNNIYQGGEDVNWTQYQANYFLINGKAWPDTMMDPQDNIVATVGQTVLVRLINAGYQVHSMHSHGYHFQVLGSDGRKLADPYLKDTLDVAPGERYEILFKFDQAGRYMFHDHQEQNTTNNGKYPGGMITMISVNNPDGSNPVPMDQMMNAS
ncbi:MAG TPA: multicopper oxidase domain-containing protein [Ktedonobacteraceae bacterium]|nr:multicopper oxidase domain-containing protein [Ktedonobacteraceae bacterium]